MSKYLVIVESPAKVKTISKFLGKEYLVKSSFGHIRDLSHKSKKDFLETEKNYIQDSLKVKLNDNLTKFINRNFLNLGIYPSNWQGEYIVIAEKQKIIRELKSSIKNIEKVFLATDLDREGESIAWHIKEELKIKDKNCVRVIFNEITEKSIKKAFLNPTIIDKNLVNAQQVRRFIDRIIGFFVSSLLRKLGRKVSAGRVQSVALRLIVEKEKQIREFIPKEYWTINIAFNDDKNNLVEFSLDKYKNDNLNLVSKSQSDKLLDLLKDQNFKIGDIKNTLTVSKAPAPFITSTLQQAASSILKFSPKLTMMIAQKLYESGKITYMRTDSTNLNQDFVKEARLLISKKYGKEYIPENLNVYIAKGIKQEAHEAIRPTSLKNDSIIKFANDREERLYRLIKQRTLASQMSNRKVENIKYIMVGGQFLLSCQVQNEIFPGFTKEYNYSSKLKSKPAYFTKNKEYDIQKTLPKQNFTIPPLRYTEASLIKELEKRNIGRPSTYVPIITNIQDRQYTFLLKRKFYATKIGELIVENLCVNLPKWVDYDFTTQMEKMLDNVAKGELNDKKELDFYYKTLLEHIKTLLDKGGISKVEPLDIKQKCTKCKKGNLYISIYGRDIILYCDSDYEERCYFRLLVKDIEQNLLKVIESDNTNKENDNETTELLELKNKKRCPSCNSTLDKYISSDLEMLICGKFPNCNYTNIEKFLGLDNIDPNYLCHKCNGILIKKMGRFGYFFVCESCEATRQATKEGLPTRPVIDPIETNIKCKNYNDDYYVIRESTKGGIFLCAKKYPKNKDLRLIKVKELKKYEKEMPDKYKFLTNQITKDPDNNDVAIGYDKKSQKFILRSYDKNFKLTKWFGIIDND